MRHRDFILTLALLAAAFSAWGAVSPASAQAPQADEVPTSDIPENEALVMRIIFEDCLGYVRHDITPFQGLATGPASPESIKDLRSPLLSRRGVVELLSPRYVASWGADSTTRFCKVQTIQDGDGPPAPRHLGVRPDGFIARVTERAVKENIPERYPGEEFSPFTVPGWHEPDTGHDSGPKRPVSFTIMPTDRNADGSIFEAGLVVMGGPPLPEGGSGAQ